MCNYSLLLSVPFRSFLLKEPIERAFYRGRVPGHALSWFDSGIWVTVGKYCMVKRKRTTWRIGNRLEVGQIVLGKSRMGQCVQVYSSMCGSVGGVHIDLRSCVYWCKGAHLYMEAHCVSAQRHTETQMSAWTNTHANTRTHISTNAHTCKFIHMYICIFTCMYPHIQVFACMCKYTRAKQALRIGKRWKLISVGVGKCWELVNGGPAHKAGW